MKTLLIMRHAKSSWADPSLPDHQRPLKKRGKRDSPRIGRLIADRGLVPDRILSSTAVRARATADKIAEACGYAGETAHLASLYFKGPAAYLEAIAELPDDAASALVVGHNPDVEALVRRLTGVEERMPTAALAQVELAVESWREVDTSTRGRLIASWRPKELDD